MDYKNVTLAYTSTIYVSINNFSSSCTNCMHGTHRAFFRLKNQPKFNVSFLISPIDVGINALNIPKTFSEKRNDYAVYLYKKFSQIQHGCDSSDNNACLLFCTRRRKFGNIKECRILLW